MLQKALALYTVRKVRNQNHYSVKSKHCPIIVYMTNKQRALELAERLNSMKEEESESLESNTY